MQVFQGNPPTLTTFVAAIGVLTGAVMTVVIDALSAERSRRLHTALYILGAVAGAFVMFILIQQDIVQALVVSSAA